MGKITAWQRIRALMEEHGGNWGVWADDWVPYFSNIYDMGIDFLSGGSGGNYLYVRVDSSGEKSEIFRVHPDHVVVKTLPTDNRAKILAWLLQDSEIQVIKKYDPSRGEDRYEINYLEEGHTDQWSTRDFSIYDSD